jgi:hypothetical protein
MSRYFYLEEYHGQVSQVQFTPPSQSNYNWARSSPQCELADLLIVAFRGGGDSSIRLTLLQAKSERNERSPTLGSRPWFKGNMEQWDLLSRRPPIQGAHSTFSPPRGLLRDAILPSVGSFGFFYRDSPQDDYHLYYNRAESLQPTYNYANRYGGRLKVSNGQLSNQRHGFVEACLAPETRLFGALTYAHLIGTPIHHVADQFENGASRTLRQWLTGVVRAAVEERAQEAGEDGIEVGKMFLESFGNGADFVEEAVQSSRFGAKSLVLIKTDQVRQAPTDLLSRLWDK